METIPTDLMIHLCVVVRDRIETLKSFIGQATDNPRSFNNTALISKLKVDLERTEKLFEHLVKTEQAAAWTPTVASLKI
jgi:hypothetical protein